MGRQNESEIIRISIRWKEPPGAGKIMLHGAGQVIDPADAMFLLPEACRLDLAFTGVNTNIGPHATVIGVQTAKCSFSFFLRDVTDTHPIYLPDYETAISETDDIRSYDEISCAIQSQGLQKRLEAIESDPEESYDEASRKTRDLKCVTWLGLSRDIRNFEISFFAMKAASDMWDCVKPRYHGKDVTLPETGGAPVRYDYFCGRGIGSILERRRWLEQGVLPILNARLQDEEVIYTYKIFVTLERQALQAEHVRGTHFLVADHYSVGSMFTNEQAALCTELHNGEIERDEETVCYIRIQAVNSGSTPRYSFVRIPQPNVHALPDLMKTEVKYDRQNGFGSYRDDRVFLIASVNGTPVPNIEMAVLLSPGEKAEYIYKIPHRPLSKERAEALMRTSYEEKLVECYAFWHAKLTKMASLNLPEKRIDEMMRAGMLHCDLVAYGNEPEGALAATIGVYSPIGSESAPIIQYFDSIGLHDLARRCIQYFIEKQHDDGFIQNFGGYMLETGCVLWTIGEHWRYTRDDAWIRSIRDNIVKAVRFIIAWREKNKREELRGHGYGMLDGKVADPEDNYHIFMLNSTAYAGIKRAVEVLSSINDSLADEFSSELTAFHEDIMESLKTGFAEAPAIPLGDGTWCPAMPVWADKPGPLSLQTSGGAWFTHGTFQVRDVLLGPQYLLLDEVIPSDSLQARHILNCLADVFFINNTAFSQPYYSPHPLANLQRGEVKAFLKEFYTNMSALADRETYTFWEHLYHVSPHKTHEEAWFMMRCRWMLYLEAGDTLTLLPGVPRAWLEHGKIIAVDGMASYFGQLTFRVESNLAAGSVTIHIKINGALDRLPKLLRVRVPHPQGVKAAAVSIGRYDPVGEFVLIDGYVGDVVVNIQF
jgi:hypothetical protein